ncbi:MAG: 16S rRNA (guanine(527)-N(7))-methyltransferase RsmG [Deltaproteobacteria bacterium]|nr:MAG: 16S rRNA (guanine(527)-N(7))-methyltransferase RsmG [Deltaproteobacteria bacterium]
MRVSSAETRLLTESAARFGVELRLEAIGRLARFLELVALWNRRVHLTGERDPEVLLRKHVVDCLAPVRHLPAAGLVVDVGSGAGFPGLVLACARPDLELRLVEARRRRASFLREAIRTIPLAHARVLEARAEAVADAEVIGRAAVVIARAVRVDAFLPLAARLVAPGGVVIAMRTPRALAPATVRAGEHVGLRPKGAWDYHLPGGERRRLLFFVAMC